MQEMTENRLVPKLRFKYFESDWIKTTLGNELDYTKGFAFKSNDYTDKGLRIVRVSDLLSSSIKANNEKVFISKDDESKYLKYKIQKGNIIITTVGSHPDLIESAVGRGIYILNNDEGLLNQNMLKFENNNTVNNKFIHSIINSPRYIHHIKSIKRGNANQANITVKELLQYKITIPSITEQQKIASFLTSVDDKINLLTKKKELLEQYKKGIMQKIFSQEIRFKDDNGNDFPDWEEKKLGEIGEFKTSSVDKLIKKDEQMVSLINYMNVYNHQSITNETTKDLMQVSANEKQIETTNLKRGDILFTPSSETPSDIGHSIVIFEDLHNTLYSYHLMRFRPTINLDILYSHYFCNIPSVLRQITRFATGSTRFTISVGSFSKIRIQLPSLKEQKKIALVLSSLDKKIDLVSSQIDKTKEFKKGLLQQMFV